MQRTLFNLVAYGVGVLLALLALELVLRLLPVPTGTHRTEDYQRWPLINNEPHRPYTYSMSWELRNARHGTTNNYGHFAPFDFVPQSHPVIVVGDSFIGAELNWYDDTLQGQLGNLLGARDKVYGIGANGLSISDYLATVGLATGEFAPRAAVILLVDGDITESLDRQIGHYDFAIKDGKVDLQYWPLYGPTLGKQVRAVVGDLALQRYLQVNLKFEPSRLFEWKWTLPEKTPAVAHEKPADADRADLDPAAVQAVDYFLDRLGQAARLRNECIVFLSGVDTYAIVDPAAASPRKDPPALASYFRTRAREKGYRFVELEPRFRAAYSAQGKRLDFWPLDRHWNGRGHAIAAQAAFETLRAGPQECLHGAWAEPSADAAPTR